MYKSQYQSASAALHVNYRKARQNGTTGLCNKLVITSDNYSLSSCGRATQTIYVVHEP